MGRSERSEVARQESFGDCKQTLVIQKWDVPTAYRKVKNC